MEVVHGLGATRTLSHRNDWSGRNLGEVSPRRAGQATTVPMQEVVTPAP